MTYGNNFFKEETEIALNKQEAISIEQLNQILARLEVIDAESRLQPVRTNSTDDAIKSTIGRQMQYEKNKVSNKQSIFAQVKSAFIKKDKSKKVEKPNEPTVFSAPSLSAVSKPKITLAILKQEVKHIDNMKEAKFIERLSKFIKDQIAVSANLEKPKRLADLNSIQQNLLLLAASHEDNSSLPSLKISSK